jgi:hypothetical protein
MEPEYRRRQIWRRRDPTAPHTRSGDVVRDIWVSCQPNQSTAWQAAFGIGGGSSPNSRALPSGLPTRPENDQFVTSVVIRLGTSPTGMTALIVLLSVSMAVTDLMAALEM